MSLFRVKDLEKVYFGEVEDTHVLHSLNFEIKSGEFVSIMGPSGSGKSSLLNIIGALQSPTNGDIFINNQQINKMNDRELTEIRKKYIRYTTIHFIYINL
jgi:putative ABC transport system ATP-binding protein